MNLKESVEIYFHRRDREKMLNITYITHHR